MKCGGYCNLPMNSEDWKTKTRILSEHFRLSMVDRNLLFAIIENRQGLSDVDFVEIFKLSEFELKMLLDLIQSGKQITINDIDLLFSSDTIKSRLLRDLINDENTFASDQFDMLLGIFKVEDESTTEQIRIDEALMGEMMEADISTQKSEEADFRQVYQETGLNLKVVACIFVVVFVVCMALIIYAPSPLSPLSPLPPIFPAN